VGYVQKKLQILGGSFNLQAPSDKIPVTDYLLSQNFRPDKPGQLFSRYGWPQKFSIVGAGNAHSVGLTGGIEGDWYTGAGSSLYHNFNPGAIATGFDGNRIGMVYFNDFMWIMNQALQGSHNAVAGFQPWNLAAPASSLSAAAASAPAVVASVTYTYPGSPIGGSIHSVTIAGTVYSVAFPAGYMYSAAYVAYELSLYARSDPNCSVTHATGASTIVIAPLAPNVAIPVSGSDGNPNATVGSGLISNLPNGTYQWYVTFQTADLTLESNSGPSSAAVVLAGQAASLTNIPVSADARVGIRNIYRVGGTLGQAYLVGSLNDNTTTTFTDSMTDLAATNGGTVMPITNDPPPPAAGMVGTYFSRLMCWNTKAHPNRLFWTDPDLPQYWPGSAPGSATGNWVDVGSDGEQIIWCSMHASVLIIYKERSVWKLIGDPDTGDLEKLSDEIGLANEFALAPAGAVDFFVGPNGLCECDTDRIQDITGDLRPLFSNNLTNAGDLTPPGSILPGANYLTNSLDAYAVALGYAMGKLYIAYTEKGGPAQGCLLVGSMGKWSYYRTGATIAPFSGFIFDGVGMYGLTGDTGGAAQAYNLDDFRGFFNADTDGTGIECVYQSHYEDCGLPDNQKVWLEVVIDIELNGDTAKIYVGLEHGQGSFGLTQVGTIGSSVGVSVRRSVGFPLALNGITGAIEARNPAVTTQLDALARNLSVAIDVPAIGQVIIHNVYLYYYEEARLAMSASTLPTDLGVGKVKQCKELELDIDASDGQVDVAIYSDLPGNALAVRQSPVVKPGGRAIWRYPFPITEGYLWRLALTAIPQQGTGVGPFRLYSARLLMRVVGVYVEAYESAAGFVFDTMEETFESLLTKIPRTFAIALAAVPIKRFREISVEIETFGGNVTLSFLTDLPNNAQVVRFQSVINTGTSGRRFWRIPLNNGDPVPWIEGRLCRLQFSGASKFILYEAAVELLPVGVYIEAYEAQGGAIYDSRELDFGAPAVKEITELELDIETTGPVIPQLYCDIVGPPALPPVTTTGRQLVLIPLTVSAATGQYAEGRLPRLCITGVNAFRLYGARLKMRPFGQYLLAAETSTGALWDSTVLDLGTQTVKQLREIQLDIWAYGAYVVTVYTDLPNNVMISRIVSPQAATNGRTNVEVPLPQGLVPDNYLFGRLVRVTITSAASFKLFGARIDARPIGCYVETYESQEGAIWDSTPLDLGNPADKMYDQLRFEMDTDGATSVFVYTDLPNETFTLKSTKALTAGPVSRRWVTVPLPSGANSAAWSVEGRSIRCIVAGAAGFRLYKGQVRYAKIGRYLAAAVGDSFSTLEFDFQSERTKTVKQIEIDMLADGIVTLSVLTSQSGQMAVEYSKTLTTPTGRQPLRINIPPGIRGRLLRLSLTSPNAARIFKLRVWQRPYNEPLAKWTWESYPLEESDVLPVWADFPIEATPPTFTWAQLPVPPTPAEWAWQSLPVNPTPPGTLATDPAQFQWGKLLQVAPTPSEWEFIDVPFSVQ
jgi:hypothetical protein